MGENETMPSQRELSPLTSGYEEEQHGVYVRFLTAGLRTPKVRNIALTGGYGSGKSSVINHIEASSAFKVLNVAISSLGDDVGAPSAGGKGADLTNRIEKAIVKQLLYRESPEKLPASEFHRMSRFPVRRAAATSALAVGGAAVVPVLLGWNPDLVGKGWVEWLAGLGILGLATAGLTWLRAFLHQRFSVSSVAAAGTSVTLARRPTSYFDKYLAEIVYFFEVTDYDVVVFEDLDRFDNPGIFEALRELNTILNESDQVGREIRFVYAVRDSVFEKIGQERVPDPKRTTASDEEDEDAPVERSGSDAGTRAASDWLAQADAAQAEVERANRTKFFDLVIPLVPFITHRSAHELLAALFPADEDHRPSDDLIDQVAGHVPEMRMLKNIRNEYCVFAEQLLVGKKAAPDLSPDTLLALVLYKHFHLADFEKIIQGRSDLDTVYKAYRRIVNGSIRLADEELRNLDSAESEAAAAGTRAAALGARFVTMVEATRNRSIVKIEVGERAFDANVSDWLALWREAGQHGSIVITDARRGSPGQAQVTVNVSDIEHALGQELSGDVFESQVARSVDADRRKHQADRDFLRGASMAELAAREEFTDPDTGRTFSQVIDTLKSQLARDLVREGHIDHNFTLYVAQFYGNRLSKNAQTFIVRNIDTNTPDPNYQLSQEEVVALLSEAGLRCLRGASAYNISIFDFLLDQKDERAHLVLDRLASFGKAEQVFVETYLSNGAHPDRLSAGLASRWPHTLVYLAVEARLDSGRRVQLLDAALASLDLEVAYDTGDSLGDFLTANYGTMKSYTAELDSTQVETIVAVTGQSGAQITDLAPLHETMLHHVVKADLYPLTAANLRAAMGAPPSISLDRVRAASDDLFEDCLNQPERYLEAADEDEGTSSVVEDPAHFVSILENVAERWDAEHVAALVERSSPDCVVEDLTDVPAVTWPALAAHDRFPATVANVEAYRDEHEIDEGLGGLLSKVEEVQVGEDPDQEVLRRLASAILEASGNIPDPACRVGLVKSLGLGGPLDPDTVPVENGRLLTLLLTHEVVADAAEVFERFADTDWGTLEPAIAGSSNFGEHASPDTLPAAMVKDFFLSSTVSDAVKDIVLGRVEEFIAADDTAAWEAAAGYQLNTGRTMDAAALRTFASASVPDVTMVRLAERYLDAGGDGSEVLVALADLGGPYAGLAGPSGAKVELPYDLNRALFARLSNMSIVASARRGRKLLSRDKVVVTL